MTKDAEELFRNQLANVERARNRLAQVTADNLEVLKFLEMHAIPGAQIAEALVDILQAIRDWKDASAIVIGSRKETL